MSLEKEFHGPNLGYILELYERYQDDPGSVDEATRKLFEGWSPTGTESALPASSGQATSNLLSLTGAANLAQAIRLYGYLSANLDPLNSAPAENPLLTLEFYNLQKEDLLNLPADILNLRGRENGNAHQAIGPSTVAQSDTITGTSASLKRGTGYIRLPKPVAFVRLNKHWMRENCWNGWPRWKPLKSFSIASIPEKHGSPSRGLTSSSPCWTRLSTRRRARGSVPS